MVIPNRSKAVRRRVRLESMDNEPAAIAYNKMMNKAPYGVFARRVLRLGIREGKLLDIACGPGQLLMALAKRAPSLELHGLDISMHLLREAADNFKKHDMDKKIQLKQGSAYDIPFEADTFDIVINTNALHYIEDPVLFFNQIYRVLKPNGIAMISDYRRDAPWVVRKFAYIHSSLNRLRNNPLEGFGKVIDACYTDAELQQYLTDSSANQWKVKASILLPLTVTIRKTPNSVE